jgi:endogenous inhibitor of DNA gyrase (YacG/DUF329 family)
MEKNIMNKKLSVKCPYCATIFSYYDSEFRPFCSERCKMIDLGHWFKETYAVPTKDDVSQVEDENGNEKESSDDQDQGDY